VRRMVWECWERKELREAIDLFFEGLQRRTYLSSITDFAPALEKPGSEVAVMEYFPMMRYAQQLRETEEFFYEQIPITRAMGVRVATYDGQQLTLVAPISLNHNHLGTAFGGSLSAVATLAGYGLLWLELQDRACHLVIRRSSLSFRRPVRRDVVAICRRPRPEALRPFKAAFEQSGKARICLEVTIEEDGLLAVEFEGLYVALK
jgi:thioesterase domain-containing protein